MTESFERDGAKVPATAVERLAVSRMLRDALEENVKLRADLAQARAEIEVIKDKKFCSMLSTGQCDRMDQRRDLAQARAAAIAEAAKVALSYGTDLRNHDAVRTAGAAIAAAILALASRPVSEREEAAAVQKDARTMTDATLDSGSDRTDPQDDDRFTPYLHVLHMEDGQKERRLTFKPWHPFGEPGRDYSEEYEVTSVRLKPEDHAQDERAMDIIKRAAAVIAGEGKSVMVDKDLLGYIFDTVNGCNRLTPRILDLCFTAFMAAKNPNKEDGGPSDWFNDTKPNIDRQIARMQERLLADSPPQPQNRILP